MSDLTINTADIAAAIQSNLDDFKPSLEQTTVGRVLEVGDGIARVSGLPDAAVNEMLRFEATSMRLRVSSPCRPGCSPSYLLQSATMTFWKPCVGCPESNALERRQVAC